jgi:DNA-binding CsgD family transcriptional regulator
MNNMASKNILPHYQQLATRQTSLQELLSASDTWPIGPMISDDLKRDYPSLTLLGVVGFDINKERFVLLRMERNEEEIWTDKRLSGREEEILQLVIAGKTNQQIAWRLSISENTVKVHLRHIFEKLRVQSRTEAAMYAVRQGWVSVTGQTA